MPRNGSGTWTRLYNWVQDRINSINILATRMDAEMDDMATGLTNSIAKDGQTTPTANLPMGGFKHTGVAAATASNDYARFDQVQNDTATWEDGAGGTGNALTLTLVPPPTSYIDGMIVRFRATAANSAAATINVNGLGVKDLTDAGGSALTANRIIIGGVYEATYVAAADDFFLSGGPTVTLTATQTLTNKTLASPTVTGALAMSSAPVNESQGADILSAATLNLDTATGNLVDVTGTTTITAITLSQGRERTVRFTGALTLTHGANLVLPGAANIITAAGDFAIFRGYAGGVVRLVMYEPFVKTGMVAGYGYSTTTNPVSTALQIPLDDTLPTNTEGAEYTDLNLSYTVKYANSLLEVEVNIPTVSLSADVTGIIALFLGTTPIQVGTYSPGSTRNLPVTLKAVVAAGSVGAKSFSVRYGTNSGADTLYLLSRNGTPVFSTADRATLSVREIRQ